MKMVSAEVFLQCKSYAQEYENDSRPAILSVMKLIISKRDSCKADRALNLIFTRQCMCYS